ncbi:S41 family peptidase [Candidatus Beckwithbacteria bacterium]|nr:S41 family peptidase [Candidatus Beckwithbacteria bacterium]
MPKLVQKLKLTTIRNLVLTLCFVIISGYAGYFLGVHQIKTWNDLLPVLKNETKGNIAQEQTINRSQPSNKNVDMSLFWQVWDKVEANYLFQDKIDYQKMVNGAAEGMVKALGDPYTAFFPPTENKTSKENLNGSFFGVGIQLGYKKDQLAVIAPLSGMPAEKLGVKAGDYILHIKDSQKGIDEDAYNLNLQDALEKIRGEKGTSVTLTLLHEGDSKSYEVTIVREEIIVPSVEVDFGQYINGQYTKEATGSGKLVAHLKLSRFGELTASQWDEAIEKILAKQKDLGGVVLDLRNNPGGYMNEAVNLSAEFLPLGKVVVKQENANTPDQIFKTSRVGRLLDMPLVVLVNAGSASASEILAGALRDNGRAKIVGTTSFGKGTIQSAEDLENGAGVHITIARWLTPNGEWVHDKGLEPDVKVDLDPNNPTVDTQLNKATEMALQ